MSQTPDKWNWTSKRENWTDMSVLCLDRTANSAGSPGRLQVVNINHTTIIKIRNELFFLGTNFRNTSKLRELAHSNINVKVTLVWTWNISVHIGMYKSLSSRCLLNNCTVEWMRKYLMWNDLEENFKNSSFAFFY